MNLSLIVAILVWVSSLFVGASIAEYKWDNGGVGFLFALFFGPLAVLILLAVPENPGKAKFAREKKMLADTKFKRCRHCLEIMYSNAATCPHCQRDQYPQESVEAKSAASEGIAISVGTTPLVEPAQVPANMIPVETRERSSAGWYILLALIAIVLLGVLAMMILNAAFIP